MNKQVRVGSELCQWLQDNSFHALVYMALRLGSPIRAMAWIRCAASLWPSVPSVNEARALGLRLGNRGTCLSRSMAIATRISGAVVAFGVDRNSVRCVSTRSGIGAHAWVEFDEIPLDAQSSRWVKVGRLA